MGKGVIIGSLDYFLQLHRKLHLLKTKVELEKR